MTSKNSSGPTHRATEAQATPRGSGFIAAGPGFHVWEETHAEALSSARGLAEAYSVRQALGLHRKAIATEDPGSEPS